MLPGFAGLVGRAGGGPFVTDFYDSTQGQLYQITRRPGYTSARITAFGGGAPGYYGNGSFFSGGGGAMSQSVVTFLETDEFVFRIEDLRSTALQLIRSGQNAQYIVIARGGGRNDARQGGEASLGVGDLRYSGGFGTNASPGQGGGGGCAGTAGNGGSGSDSGAGARGLGEFFTQTSNGLVLINGAGFPRTGFSTGRVVGGGGWPPADAFNHEYERYEGDPGAVVIEWGYR